MAKSKEEILAEMDVARDKAAEDFKQVIAQHPEGVEALGQWWKDNFGSAGHKRLAYVLMSVIE